MSFSYLEIFLIIFTQIVILFLYHLFTKKEPTKKDIFKDKLELVNTILKNTKHDKIVTLDKIKDIELQADSVTVFSQDIYRDVKDNGQFSDSMHSISTFYDTVATNIQDGTSYKYFLKKDANFRHSLISFFTSHTLSDNIEFYIIPSEKYYFYDEVYLYNINGKKRAFEFLPSISNEEEQRLFYLELDPMQVKRLESIEKNLIDKYKDESVSEVAKIKSKLSEFSKI